MPLSDDVKRAFRETRIDLPCRGGVTIGATIGVPPGLVDRPGYVITAQNPCGQTRGPAYNAAANDQLRRHLELRAIAFEEATGRSPDGTHCEEGFFVEMDEREALAVGATFGQLAIFRIAADGVHVLECPAPPQSGDARGGQQTDSGLVFTVTRFAPSRCPGCLARFAGPDDFALWAAADSANSFPEAIGRQAKLFPELFESHEEPEGVASFANPQRADFIVCVHCDNKTVRLKLAEQVVESLADAERLIAVGGYTTYTRAVRIGDVRLDDLGR